MVYNSDTHEGVCSRRQMIASTIATGSAVLAGCIGTGDREDESDDSDTGESEMANEIQGWGWDVAARSMELTAEEYNGEHDAAVEIEEFGQDAMKEDLQTRLTSGSGAPELSMLEMIDGPSYIDTGAILEITDRIEEADVYDDFVSGVWEALSDGDDIYALPWDIGPTAVFYRRDVYEEHGLDPDAIETWGDFIEQGQQLPDDTYMLNIPENDLDGFWRFQLRQLEGEPFTEDGAVNIHSETSLQVAQNIKNLYDAGIASMLEEWSSAWFGAYGGGDIASLASAAWMEGTLRDELPETEGDWGVYKVPAHEEGGSRASNWGGSSLMIPDQHDEAETNRAWDYIRWTAATEDMQLLMYDEYGLFPALETTYDADIFEAELDFFDGQPAREIFAEVAEEIPSYRFTEDTPQVSQAINDEFQRMLRDDQTPEEAVQAAAETVADNTGRDIA